MNFRRTHAASLWWMAGLEIGLPIALVATIISVMAALIMALGILSKINQHGDYGLGPMLLVAAAPLLIWIFCAMPFSLARIASVYRSEALAACPGRRRESLSALLTLQATVLIPGIILSVLGNAVSLFAVLAAYTGASLLGGWYIRPGSRAHESINGVANLLPWLTLIAVMKLQHLIAGPHLTAALIAFALCVSAFRTAQIFGIHSEFAYNQRRLPLHLSPITHLFPSSDALWRATFILAWVLLYQSIGNHGSGIMLASMLANTLQVSDLEALQHRLRLLWINGSNRTGLIKHALLICIRNQLSYFLLTFALLSSIAAMGWLAWDVLFLLFGVLCIGAVPMLAWQLPKFARSGAEPFQGTFWQQTSRNTVPFLVTLPWVFTTTFSYLEFKDNPIVVAMICLAMATLLTAAAWPRLRKAFQYIEL